MHVQDLVRPAHLGMVLLVAEHGGRRHLPELVGEEVAIVDVLVHVVDDGLAIVHFVHLVLMVAHVLGVALVQLSPDGQSVEGVGGTHVVIELSRVLVPLHQVV